MHRNHHGWWWWLISNIIIINSFYLNIIALRVVRISILTLKLRPPYDSVVTEDLGCSSAKQTETESEFQTRRNHWLEGWKCANSFSVWNSGTHACKSEYVQPNINIPYRFQHNSAYLQVIITQFIFHHFSLYLIQFNSIASIYSHPHPLAPTAY